MLSLSVLKTLEGSAHQLAAANSNAPVSALIWLIIPFAALTGGLAYAFWVTRLKSKYENQTERSVGRFKKFQDSFDRGIDAEGNTDNQKVHIPDTNKSDRD